MKKKLTFELAPQIKQRQVAMIEEIFTEKVLGMEGALVTDESRISDFLWHPPERAIGPGKAPGTLRFIQRMFIGKGPPSREQHLDLRNWRVSEVEEVPGIGRDEIIEKTKAVFGVDISEFYDEYLVDILLHIAEKYNQKEEK